MELLKRILSRNREYEFNPKYYKKVSNYMLKKPRKKVNILVTGWGEFLPIICVETEI